MKRRGFTAQIRRKESLNQTTISKFSLPKSVQHTEGTCFIPDFSILVLDFSASLFYICSIFPLLFLPVIRHFRTRSSRTFIFQPSVSGYRKTRKELFFSLMRFTLVSGVQRYFTRNKTILRSKTKFRFPIARVFLSFKSRLRIIQVQQLQLRRREYSLVFLEMSV
jgi:hypothetical protein